MWLILLAACANSPADDIGTYARLVGLESPQPADLEACGRLADPNLAGDCALALSQRVAAQEKTSLSEWCDEVPAGVWRYECWFQAAELERRRGREAEAAENCRSSGPFLNDCAQHLWQTRVHRLIQSNGKAPDFVGKLARAEQLYGEWAPHLAETSDLETRFWNKYYQNGFESAGRIDLAWCDGLPEAHAPRCLTAARDLVIREMAPNLDRNSAWSAFCAMEKPTSAEVARWFRLTPSEPLDALVQERQALLCKN